MVNQKGFTFIEILLFLMIAGLIIVMIMIGFSGAQKSRRDTARKNDLNLVGSMLERYAANNGGNYPNDGAGTGTNDFLGGFKTGYIDTLGLKDPAKSSYSYAGSITICNATDYGRVMYDLHNTQTRQWRLQVCLENGLHEINNY